MVSFCFPSRGTRRRLREALCQGKTLLGEAPVLLVLCLLFFLGLPLVCLGTCSELTQWSVACGSSPAAAFSGLTVSARFRPPPSLADVFANRLDDKFASFVALHSSSLSYAASTSTQNLQNSPVVSP